MKTARGKQSSQIWINRFFSSYFRSLGGGWSLETEHLLNMHLILNNKKITGKAGRLLLKVLRVGWRCSSAADLPNLRKFLNLIPSNKNLKCNIAYEQNRKLSTWSWWLTARHGYVCLQSQHLRNRRNPRVLGQWLASDVFLNHSPFHLFIHPSIHLFEAGSLIGARYLPRLAGSGDPPLHLSTCSTPELLLVWQSTLFYKSHLSPHPEL